MIKQLPPNCNARIAKVIEIKLNVNKNIELPKEISSLPSQKNYSPKNEEPFFNRNKSGDKS